MLQNRPEYQAKQLGCCDCGDDFIFTAGEQAFFESKQLSIPHRCPQCRRDRKARLVPDSNRAVQRP